MKKSETRFYHYILVAVCVFLSGVVAFVLGIHNAAAGAIVISVPLICGIGGIGTFFYYLIISIVEALAFLICSLVAKSFSYMLLPLVPFGFSLLMFIIQTTTVMYRKQ